MARNDNDGTGTDHRGFRRHGYRAPRALLVNTPPSTIPMLDYTSLYFVCYLLHLHKRALYIKNIYSSITRSHKPHHSDIAPAYRTPPWANKLTKLRDSPAFLSISSTCRPTYWLDLIHTIFRQIRTSQVHLRQLPPQAHSTISHSSTHHNRAHRPRTTQHL